MRLQPGTLDDSVLVLIDCQLEYLTGALPLSGIQAAIAENAALLRLAREARTPVVHVIHHNRPGAVLVDPCGPFAAIIPDLAPHPGEMVVVKSLPSAFAKTSLASVIDDTDRRSLIFGGFMTHMCVSTTVRAAVELGYRCTVVAGATATRDLPDPGGGAVIPASAVQRIALAELADRFAVIVSTAAALRSLTKSRP